MIKNYVLDTNVLMHDPKSLYQFQDNCIVIPIVVIEELDGLKRAEGMVGYHARQVLKELNALRENGDFVEGVSLPGGGKIRIEMNHMEGVFPEGVDPKKNDNRIIAVAKNLMEEDKIRPTILVTKDMCMTVKADALGIKAQDYETDKIRTEDLYSGYSELVLSSKDIDKVYGGGLKLKEVRVEEEVNPNHFFHIKGLDCPTHETVAKLKKGKIVPFEYMDERPWGLKPLNMEQKMAIEALYDPDIHFVSLIGGAGSGKTILSVAYALQSVLQSELYRKIIYVKPVVAAGGKSGEIGFLPGDERAKLGPVCQSFGDSVDVLFQTKTHKGIPPRSSAGAKPEFSVEHFLCTYQEAGIIEMKTFNYMRGRSLTDSLVIVDEAQETTPHIAKLMLTRAGYGSKFLFLGDPSDNQIDNTLVDSKSNGLVYVVDKMRYFDITAHITLRQVERSPLAQLAERNM